MKLAYATWAEKVHQSVSALSRTAKGTTAAAYGGAKPALEVSDATLLAQKTAENLSLAIDYVWKHGLAIRPQTHHVLGFMNAVAKQVSEGLLRPGQSLWRTWDTREKYPTQVLPSEIEVAMELLGADVAAALLDPQQDPVKLAALLEREIDGHIHPYADGCGRTAKLLGAWALLRSGMLPAYFTDRAAYYGAMAASEEEWYKFYRSHVPVLATT